MDVLRAEQEELSGDQGPGEDEKPFQQEYPELFALVLNTQNKLNELEVTRGEGAVLARSESLTGKQKKRTKRWMKK